ncbi:response regulator [Chelatococcus sp. SYSU_G07232]|uniref:Response regulator n=1 Tax=Chelatococcus albus TaxID=3047466 RepID=A0ABT7AD71_9HYPH|nr:response regulator [Chelatococcus sp. SYSU_G07232]MDJ1157323.1 response regulator [Chelatococcus sp. SYSU_G07232]
MTTATRVLVVDDEPQIQRFLKPSLTAAGYEVAAAADGREALRLIATTAPDVVVLDLGLPDMDGKEVIAAVREWSQVPIIVLSARDREAEKIAALDLGADDYVNKPFGIGELMARLRAALRHKAREAGETEVFRSGELVVDTVKRLVTRRGERVRLTPKEYDLLHVLTRHAGRVVTHRQLLQAVWGPAHVEDTQYLRVFVGQLRQKIEEDPAEPRLVLTEPGVGYRFAPAGEGS